jgi:hypothetical protein
MTPFLPAVPLAIAAVLWLASGAALGCLLPFTFLWSASAAACVAVCAVTGTAVQTLALAVNLPLAAGCWVRSRGPGVHAGRVAFRARGVR